MFYAELNALLKREFAEDGYSGVEVRTTPSKTEIVIRATRLVSYISQISQKIVVNLLTKELETFSEYKEKEFENLQLLLQRDSILLTTPSNYMPKKSITEPYLPLLKLNPSDINFWLVSPSDELALVLCDLLWKITLKVAKLLFLVN